MNMNKFDLWEFDMTPAIPVGTQPQYTCTDYVIYTHIPIRPPILFLFDKNKISKKEKKM